MLWLCSAVASCIGRGVSPLVPIEGSVTPIQQQVLLTTKKHFYPTAVVCFQMTIPPSTGHERSLNGSWAWKWCTLYAKAFAVTSSQPTRTPVWEFEPRVRPKHPRYASWGEYCSEQFDTVPQREVPNLCQGRHMATRGGQHFSKTRFIVFFPPRFNLSSIWISSPVVGFIGFLQEELLGLIVALRIIILPEFWIFTQWQVHPLCVCSAFGLIALNKKRRKKKQNIMNIQPEPRREPEGRETGREWWVIIVYVAQLLLRQRTLALRVESISIQSDASAVPAL